MLYHHHCVLMLATCGFLQVKRWKEWEVLAKEQGVQPIPDK